LEKGWKIKLILRRKSSCEDQGKLKDGETGEEYR
jgi:hypothetical protein